MNALCIDCAVSKIAVAAKKDLNYVKVVLDIGNRQSEKLLPTIDYVMKETGLEVKDLDYTAVTLGPGTFTGLRLGLSALKSLNLSNNIPVYGIPSLDAYSWGFKESFGNVISVIEAKEDEYFYSFYNGGKKLTLEDDKPLVEILKEIDAESTVLVTGPGAKYFVERAKEISPLHKLYTISCDSDACTSLFEIAEEKIKNNEKPLEDYDGPLYVRKSEAEIVLESKNAKQ